MNVDVLPMTKPLSAELRMIIVRPDVIAVPVGLVSRRDWSQFHRRAFAPVNPAGMSGVGKPVGKVSVKLLMLAPALA